MKLVVDFGIATGLGITHKTYGRNTPWNKKAEIIKRYDSAFCLCHREYERIPIHKTIRTLQPFGGRGTYPGLTVRPKMMTNELAEVSIIENMLTFQSEGGLGDNPRNKTGAVNHLFIYRGL